LIALCRAWATFVVRLRHFGVVAASLDTAAMYAVIGLAFVNCWEISTVDERPLF
jgi:hypothetical protein